MRVLMINPAPSCVSSVYDGSRVVSHRSVTRQSNPITITTPTVLYHDCSQIVLYFCCTIIGTISMTPTIAIRLVITIRLPVWVPSLAGIR